MKFTVDQKIQIIKWYFNGISLPGTVNSFITKYGSEHGTPSMSGIRYMAQLFETNGCLQNCCRQCIGHIRKSSQMSDEAELNEIMVCAAAELELSVRNIAVELEMAKSTVFKILKKNGYSTTSAIVEPTLNETLEKLSDEREHVIRWYSQKKSLPEMISLFDDHFTTVKKVKEEIINSIKLFEMYGCIRDCGKCQGNINKAHKNSCLNIEDMVMKQSNQLRDKDESQIENSSDGSSIEFEG